jgi:hypothetical protein
MELMQAIGDLVETAVLANITFGIMLGSANSSRFPSTSENSSEGNEMHEDGVDNLHIIVN